MHKRHQYPRTYAQISGSVLSIGYGDPRIADVLLNNDLLSITSDGGLYSNEFLLIEIDCAQKTIRVQRDIFCTLPLFIGTAKNQIVITNTCEKTCELLPQSFLRISKSELYNFLNSNAIRPPGSIIENVKILGECEQYTWEQGEGEFRQIPHLTHPHASLDNNEDPVIFKQLFDTLLEEYAHKYSGSGAVGCEFSGGIDSALIAGSLLQYKHPVELACLGYPEAFGNTQEQKISDFASRFSTKVFTQPLHFDTLFPLSRMVTSRQWQPFYQNEEIYREAFSQLALHFKARGVTTVFNGMGGDEILTRYAGKEDPSDPINDPSLPLPSYFTDRFKQAFNVSMSSAPYRQYEALMPPAILSSKVNHNNAYLEHGLWPVSPFSDPRLFLYCQGLPLRFRTNKNIYKIYASAWQYPESVYNPIVNEDFSIFFQGCFTRHYESILKQWLRHSELAQAGLIDVDKALHYFDIVKNSGGRSYDIFKLIVAESNIQTLGLSIE